MAAAFKRSCALAKSPLCGGLPIALGCEALDALRRRSAQDPWWAVLSAVMHGGPINYNTQQPWVDKLARLGPYAVTNLRDAAVAAYGSQFWVTRACMLVVAQEVYLKYKPHTLLRTPTRDRFLDELQTALRGDAAKIHWWALVNKIVTLPMGYWLPDQRKLMREADEVLKIAQRPRPKQGKLLGLGDAAENKARRLVAKLYPEDTDKFTHPPLIKVTGSRGIGEKAKALAAEYLGDPNAVAADRHVTNWICNVRGGGLGIEQKDGSIKIVQFKRDQPIPKALFNAVVKGVREEAAKCGIEPAALQVAAWVQGACCSDWGLVPFLRLYEGAEPLNCRKFFGNCDGTQLIIPGLDGLSEEYQRKVESLPRRRQEQLAELVRRGLNAKLKVIPYEFDDRYVVVLPP